MVLTLRKPTLEDKESILKMFEEMTPEDGRRCGGSGFWDVLQKVGFEKWFEANELVYKGEHPDYSPAEFHLICLDSEVVGYSLFDKSARRMAPDFGYGVVSYYIKPEFQSRGYGTEQLRLTIERMKAVGYSQFRIATQPDNFASRRIIEKLGGKFEKKDYYWNCGDVEIFVLTV